MRQEHGGITLVEVLVVVALVAVLAAIAVCVVLRGKKRATVAQARKDMGSMAPAIRAYYHDNGLPPTWGIGHTRRGNVRTYNWEMARRTGNRSGVADLPSFLLNDPSNRAGYFQTLTSPIDYLARIANLSEYPVDRYCFDRRATFVYWSVIPGQMGPDGKKPPRGFGWILVSPGPDGAYDLPGCYDAYDPAARVHAMTPGKLLPNPRLLAGVNPRGSAFTYDPTNGLESNGDIWRIQQ